MWNVKLASLTFTIMAVRSPICNKFTGVAAFLLATLFWTALLFKRATYQYSASALMITEAFQIGSAALVYAHADAALSGCLDLHAAGRRCFIAEHMRSACCLQQ